MKKLAFIAGILLLVLACNDNQFPDQPSAPEVQFYLEGEVNTQNVSLKAGEDDYFMFTDYTYDQGDNRFVFQGKLSQVFCINCGSSLNIEIRDSLKRAADFTYGDGVPFSAKEIDYKLSIQSPGVQFQFNSSVDTADARSYFWNFGDGSSSTVKSPKHIYKEANQNQRIPVTHKVVRKDSCETEIKREIDILFEPSTDSCILDFEVVLEKDSVAQFYTLIPTVEDFGQRFYLWQIYINNQNEPFKFSNEKFFSFTLEPADQISKIILITEDIACSGEVEKIYSPTEGVEEPKDAAICDLSFDQEKQFLLAPAPEVGSMVCITWENEEGIEYRSDRFGQPTNSMFRVNSVEAFEENERGQKTVKLDITFSCELTAENGESIWVENMSGIFGVAFP
ncbi:MAG: PKD domain-containing protein [Bacteroidota bacterium]